MKSIFTFCLLLVISINFTSCVNTNYELQESEEESNVKEEHFNYTIGNGPFVYFEDNTLKEILLNNFTININLDNEITFDEALAFNGKIKVSDNEISSMIGIEKFENIVELNFARNKVTSIDLSQNIMLENLNCAVNPFSVINLENNINLKFLEIRTTKIAYLDISNNINLKRVTIICSRKLKRINIKNGNNINVFLKCSYNNPLLECILVDDVNFAESGDWWIPNQTIYSLDCNIDSTND